MSTIDIDADDTIIDIPDEHIEVTIEEELFTVVVDDTQQTVVIEEEAVDITVADEGTTVVVEVPEFTILEACVQGPPGPTGQGGPPGVIGPVGPQGPAGSGTEVPFIFTQSSPSALWHIVHGRGSNPNIVIERDDGLTIAGFGTEYTDVNTVDLFFGQPIRGVATLNF